MIFIYKTSRVTLTSTVAVLSPVKVAALKINKLKMKLEKIIAVLLIWILDNTTGYENGSLTVYGTKETGNEQAVSLHSRRKRYIVFPKGSSLQLLLEILVHVPTQFQVVVGPTLQVAWPLPSEISRTSRFKRSSSTRNTNVKQHFSNVFRFDNSPTKEILVGRKKKIFNDLATFLDLFGMTVGLAWQLPDDPMIYSEFKKKHKIYKRNVFKKMEAFLRPGGANGQQCVLKALCESGQRTPSKKGFLREILHKIFSMEDPDEEDENQEDKLYRKAHQSVNQNCDTLYPDCKFSVFDAIQ